MIKNDYVPRKVRNWIIASSVLLVLLLHLSLLRAMFRFESKKPDFAYLYEAGKSVIDRHSLDDAIEMWGAQGKRQTATNNIPADTMHPPFEMVLFAPLALLDYKSAYLVWWVCNLVLLLSFPALLWKHLPNLHHSYAYLIILIGTFFPVFVAVIQGQDSILLLFLLTLSFTCLADGKEFLAGFALAMGMFKFVLVIPMALSLLVERRWRALSGFSAGCATLLLISIGIAGTNGLLAYLRVLAGYSRATPERAGTESIMPNLRGFVHAMGSGVVSEKWLAIFVLVASFAILVLIDARLARSGTLALRFSTQVLLATVVSYHLYPHDASILLLPMVLLFEHCLNFGVTAPIRLTVVIASAVAYLCPLVAPLQVSMPILFCISFLLLVRIHFSPEASEYGHAVLNP